MAWYHWFSKRSYEKPQLDCIVKLSSEEGVDNIKEDRSNKILYETVGRNQYGTGVPPTYDTPINALLNFPIVYACVKVRSENAAGVGVKVYQVNGSLETEVSDHPFYSIFKNPNPLQSSFEFMEEVLQSLDVTGNAFISIEKASSKMVELYLLPTKYMSIIPDGKQKVKEYRFYSSGQFVTYKPEEIIHIKYNHIDDKYYGYPPLASAASILNFETSRQAFANRFFDNGAVPAGVLEVDSNIGDNRAKSLRQEWQLLYGGIRNAHKIAILQGGMKYKAIASPLKDLDLGNLRKFSKEDIQMMYQVPESLLGNMDNTSGAEGKEALTAFWRSALIPLLRRVESSINRGLAQTIFAKGQYIFKFNLKNVEALADDKESTASYLSSLLSSSVITPNEARAYIGFPLSTDPNADKLYISNSMYGNQLIPTEGGITEQIRNNTEKPKAAPTKKT